MANRDPAGTNPATLSLNKTDRSSSKTNTMKTKSARLTSPNQHLTTPVRLSAKRKVLLERYYSNALVLAALLESAQVHANHSF